MYTFLALPCHSSHYPNNGPITSMNARGDTILLNTKRKLAVVHRSHGSSKHSQRPCGFQSAWMLLSGREPPGQHPYKLNVASNTVSTAAGALQDKTVRHMHAYIHVVACNCVYKPFRYPSHQHRAIQTMFLAECRSKTSAGMEE